MEHDLHERCLQVRVGALDAVVEDGDGDALAGDAHLPRALHVHVEAVAAVQVPHLREPEVQGELKSFIRVCNRGQILK